MGNAASEPDKPTEEPPVAPPEEEEEEEEEDLSYQWPVNLHVELRDMAEVSFLIYMFAYLVNIARKNNKKSEDDDDDENVKKEDFSDLDELQQTVDEDSNILMRIFTPQQVLDIVQNHMELLKDNPDFPSNPDSLTSSLSQLIQRVPTDNPKALTLVDYDDVFQKAEFVYAIGKDDINKRITLILRGTDNELAMKSNWATNLSITKEKVSLPQAVMSYVKFDKVWIHQGFWNYVMKKTKTSKDAPETTKYEQVLDAVSKSLAAHPGYKLYVTGHSLGAALSTVFSFLLAAEPSLPKPVTCINFASPRVGDSNFLEACEAMEKHHLLRMCRVVNDKDTIATVPTINFHHVGFQIKLFKNDEKKEPEITYPKLQDSWWKRFDRAWDNSFVSSINLQYDHGDYRERVLANEEALRSFDLNDLYHDSNLTGFHATHHRDVEAAAKVAADTAAAVNGNGAAASPAEDTTTTATGETEAQ